MVDTLSILTCSSAKQVVGGCGAKVGEFVDNFQDLFVDGDCWNGVDMLAHDVGFLQAEA